MRGLRIGWIVFGLAALGCGEEGTGTNNAGVIERPTCDEIGKTCHHTETQLGQECHEFGHDHTNTEEDCKARYEECMAECKGSGHGH